MIINFRRSSARRRSARFTVDELPPFAPVQLTFCFSIPSQFLTVRSGTTIPQRDLTNSRASPPDALFKSINFAVANLRAAVRPERTVDNSLT